MLRRARLRAPAALLLATSLGLLAAAATPIIATAAPLAPSGVTRPATASPVEPDAKLRSLLPQHAPATPHTQARKTSNQPATTAGESALCSRPTSPLVAQCYAIRVNGVAGGKGLRADASPPAGLSPSALDSAYNLPANGGAGATIGIVDAYDDPNAAADLAVYRQQFGLPPLGSGQFIKVNQDGVQGDYPQPDSHWSGEISLDLDMVSAIAPKATIILVEATSPGVDDLGASVNEAVALGAGYVSNSYGASEASEELQLSQKYYDHPGVAVVAASGDGGYGVSFPAASPYVTSVGGTSLTHSSTARGWTETVWSNDLGAPGSGCSTVEPKPSFQVDAGCSMRTVADVSAVADPYTGVAAYDTYGSDSTGWMQVGGTSVATPIIASTYALAGPVTKGTYPNSYPYAYPHLNDVTSGSTTTCDPSYLCTAEAGYDGPTGLGTPDGTGAFSYVPTGTLSGTITDSSTHAPIAGANVTVTDSVTQLTYRATTGSTGAYHLPTVSAGTYDVSASVYGYGTGTEDAIAVTVGQSATGNLALTKTPAHVVSGTVTDGSGQGWPLYAKITVDGSPNGPVYTNPATGAYSMSLPAGASYTIHVTPVSPGYTPATTTVTLGSSDVRHDVSVAADTTVCDAPGYGYPAQANFDDWTTGPRYGWTVTNNNGGTYGWEFDQLDWQNLSGGTGNFALADPDDRNVAEDTDLISPSFSLAGVKQADLRFDAVLVVGTAGAGEIDASISTNGGATWTTVYQQAGPLFQGSVHVPLTQALGHSQVRLRLHFQGQGATLAQLDDVSVGQCQALSGGLIEGNVIDANTHQGVNSATITDSSAPVTDPYNAAVSADAPGAGQPDGFYWLYSPKTGGNNLTITTPRYATAHATVMVSHSTRRYDPSLQAGRLKVTPGKMSLATTAGGKASQQVTLTNTGGAPIKITLAEQNQSVSSAAASSTPAAASWQALPAYPEPVIYNAVGSYEGKTYSVGGNSGLLDGTIYDNGYVYQPGASSWSPIANLPEPRSDAASAFLDGTLYVVGGQGYDASGKPGVAESTTWAYHPGSNTWSQEAALPQGLDRPAAAVLDGKLYVIGGADSAGENLSAAYRYNPATNTWSRIADYPVAIMGTGCGGIIDTIVCAGGVLEVNGNANGSDSTYVYHPDSNSWAKAAAMPYGVFGASYSSANGELQVTGGWDGAARAQLTTVIQYDPASNVWTYLPSAPQAMLAAGTGTGCGLTLIGGSPPSNYFPAGSTSALSLPGFGQCTGDDVSWLSGNNTTIELAPGHSARIRVTADARGLAAPGTYAATVDMITDSPYIYPPVPVTLKATAPRHRTTVSLSLSAS